jgi:uncharacterized oligopeptide transporter (OPT) family protein
MGARLPLRALVTALLVAATVGALFPYVTLRLGFGPNVSLVSTLLGSIFFSALGGGRARWALHAAQAAGVAAGQTAFMCIALLAFELLRDRPGFALSPSPWIVFVWLAGAGTIGVLAALPLRKHYLEEEKLSFAAGEAAAETILVLERAQRPRVAAFLVALGAAALVALSPLRAVSPIALGSGLLIRLRVALSLAFGMGAAYALGLPTALVMWIAAGLMIGGGLTTVAVRAPALVRGLARSAPRPAVLIAAGGALALLCVADRLVIGFPVWLTLASVAVSLPLMLVGTRVLGETNWAPVAVLGTTAQVALAPLVPGCAFAAMVGSTVAAAIPNGAQHMMQSLRAAAIVGARPRETAIAQLLGVLVGAASLSLGFPMLVAKFGVREGGLWSPLSVSWAGSAEAMTRGVGAVPAALACAGLAIGALLAILERRAPERAPSPTALGMGMLMSAGVVLPLLAGSALAAVLRRRIDEQRVPAAAGLVVGEALVACAQAVLAAAV